MSLRIKLLFFSFVLLCCGVVIVCNWTIAYPSDHEHDKQFRDSLNLSLVLYLPMALDAFLEFVVQRHAERTFSWPLQLFVAAVPNVLKHFDVLQPGIFPTVMYFQHTCILLLQQYRIQRMASFRGVETDSFGRFFAFLSACFLSACLRNLSAVGAIPGHRVLAPLCLGMTIAYHCAIIKGAVNLARQAWKPNSVLHYVGFAHLRFAANLLLLSLSVAVPFIDLVLIQSHRQMLFADSEAGCVYLEFLFIVSTTATSLLRSFESRLMITSAKAEHEHTKSTTRAISHEVRTPLNTAFMGLELLKDSLCQSPAIEITEQQRRSWIEGVDNVREACNAALSILNQFLTFDKLSSKMLLLDLHLVRVLDVLDANVRLFRMQAIQAGIDFRIAISHEELDALSEVYLNVDEHKMNQVLRNLLSNAMKFTPRHGVVSIKIEHVTESASVRSSAEKVKKTDEDGTPSLTGSLSRSFSSLCELVSPRSNAVAALPITSASVAGASPTNNIRISVIDSGPGVDKEDQAKLFQEYVQINPGELQKGQGSGLGLSISKAIVALHGGRVGMTSEGKDKGSTFYVELPAYKKHKRHAHDIFALPHTHSHDESDDFHVLPLPAQLKYKLQSSNNIAATPFASGPAVVPSSLLSMNRMDSELTLSVGGDRERDCECTDTESLVRAMSWRRLRVLLVDDCVSNRKMLSRLLSFKGHTVVEATDGTEAVEIMKQMISQQRLEEELADVEDDIEMGVTYSHTLNASSTVVDTVDVILMDFFMTHMNGPEAATAIRALGFAGPILGVTGAMDEEADHFLACGVNLVLQKPIDMKAICKAFQTLQLIS